LLVVAGATAACATRRGHEGSPDTPDAEPEVAEPQTAVESPAARVEPAECETQRTVPLDEHTEVVSNLRFARRRIAAFEKTVAELTAENEVLRQEVGQVREQLAKVEAERDRLQKKLDAILSPPSPPAQPDEPARNADAYTVQPGDSFRKIAAKTEVYGNGERWVDLYEANRERLGLEKPEDLQAGMVIEIKRP